MSTAAEQAMGTFTAQWYNTLTTALGLRPDSFQLIQGGDPLKDTSEELWSYFNAIPPASLTRYYNASQVQSFADTYGAVVNNLKPQDSPVFRQILGDDAAKWDAYRAAHSDQLPAGGPLEQFTNWAWANLPDPGTAQSAITAFSQSMNGAISTAVTLFNTARGGTFAYTATIKALRDAIGSSLGAQFTMDSSKASSDVSRTWASGAVSANGGLFSADASGSYQALAIALASSSVQVSASFKRVTHLTAAPLSQPSSLPGLLGSKPWYNSAALAMAYSTPDNTVWKSNASPTWDTTFGPNGNLQRMVTEIVVVDGIDISITSAAPVSTNNQQALQAAASGGFWPFFGVSASGGDSKSMQFSDDGKLRAHISLPAGNPQVLGVLTTPIGEVLGVAPTARSAAVANFAKLG